MRNLILLSLAFVSCRYASGNKDLEEIPGIYVRSINHEFATGSDTLIVELLDLQTGTFTIIKRSGFVQYLNGKTVERKHNSEKFTVLYDEPTGTLNDNHKMKNFTPIPDKGLLLSGGITYKKTSP